jgi:hypothetical protein
MLGAQLLKQMLVQVALIIFPRCALVWDLTGITVGVGMVGMVNLQVAVKLFGRVCLIMTASFFGVTMIW